MKYSKAHACVHTHTHHPHTCNDKYSNHCSSRPSVSARPDFNQYAAARSSFILHSTHMDTHHFKARADTQASLVYQCIAQDIRFRANDTAGYKMLLGERNGAVHEGGYG